MMPRAFRKLLIFAVFSVLPTVVSVAAVAEEIVVPGVGTLSPDAIVPSEFSAADLDRTLRFPAGFAGPDGPGVTFVDGVATYTGATDARGYDALAKIARENAVATLAVSSLGGEVFWGLKIGELVFANGWDVEVRGQCFSACANYIFPAGRRKVVAADALVGWHGGARQNEVLAEQAGTDYKTHFVRTMIPPLLEGFLNAPAGTPPLTGELLAQILSDELGRDLARRKLEADFYRRVGVDGRIAVYGLLPEAGGAAKNAGGWTFRISDMEKFGVRNVRWLGDGEYPAAESLPLLGLALLSVSAGSAE